MLAPTHRTSAEPDNVIHLTGILDVRSVGDVRQTLNHLIDTSDGDVIVDLEEVDAVDATGLGLLVATHRRTQSLGRQLVPVGLGHSGFALKVRNVHADVARAGGRGRMDQ